MIRVLLADDQSLVRAGFRALLDAQPDIEVAGRQPTARKPCAWWANCGPTSC